MANQTLDFKELNPTNISGPNFDIGTNELQTFFYPYHLYVEERTINDIPEDSKTNLYNLYDAGINNLKEDDWTITVGERISSHTQIYLTNNYSKILSIFSTASGNYDTIHYDDLIRELSSLESLTTENAMTAMVMQWINKYVVDFTINQNPENADDTNLILTQALTSDIQTITENILKKVFRNLVQTIRFKRDYRMYGPSSTIYGNCYNSAANCQTHTAIPASCFTQRTNHYIVGKKAYGDELKNIEDTIQNSVFHISPHNSYEIAKHVHGVTISIDDLESTVTYEKLVVNDDRGGNKEYDSKYVDSDDGPGSIPWGDMADGRLVCDWKTGASITILSTGSYEYFWRSDNKTKCQLVSQTGWRANPWNNEDVKLPTYSTRMWVWEHDDRGTNIINPTEYM